jgi:hypothetical protein
VLTANQALLWAALRAAGADPAMVTGYGRLFGVCPADSGVSNPRVFSCRAKP